MPSAPCTPEPKWTGTLTSLVFAETFAMMLLGWLVPKVAFSMGGATGAAVGTHAYDIISTWRLIGWLVTLLLLGVIVVTIGKGTTGLWRGAFVDPRNWISLSRIQMIFWTILVISAWVAAVLGNYSVGSISASTGALPASTAAGAPAAQPINPEVVAPGGSVTVTGTFPATYQPNYLTFDGLPVDEKTIQSWSAGSIVVTIPDTYRDNVPWRALQPVQVKTADSTVNGTIVVSKTASGVDTSPIDVAVPAELWAAMGISIVSLIGAPIIAGRKRRDSNETDASASLMAQVGRSQDTTLAANGLLVEKPCPDDSSFGDLFRGEETGNIGHMDLGKAQMFIFTAVLVTVYFAGLWAMFSHAGTTVIAGLPPLSSGFVALLALSHAGYLGFKAAPHGGSSDGTDPARVPDAEPENPVLKNLAEQPAPVVSETTETSAAPNPGP